MKNVIMIQDNVYYINLALNNIGNLAELYTTEELMIIGKEYDVFLVEEALSILKIA